MAIAQTDPQPAAATAPRRSSVLIVLTVRNGAAWLPETLAAIATQTYDRLGVIAVDRASTDTSPTLLTQALGEGRVIRLPDASSTAAAFAAGLADPRAAEADYIFLLHDDAVPDPDAVTRLVETAEAAGISGVGVVGSKVLDRQDPHLLLDVGVSSDRSGHRYSPLETQEMDHGQHDRVREVFAVSACAVLIAREAWQRIGGFDERLDERSAELDYCWRARVAGYRVIWSPLARVRHEAAGMRGLRPEAGRRADRPRRRYLQEQGAVAACMKNYRLRTLLWLFPLLVLQAAARVTGLVFSRRFEEAWQVVEGWLWNLWHLPGTLVRRRRVQHARRTRDHAIRPFMITGAVRMRRLVEAFERLLPGEVELPDEEDGAEQVRLRAAAASAIHAHPVATTWILSVFLALIATRHLWGVGQLTGGAVPVMPLVPQDLFAELVSGVRTTALGGTQAGSPALAILGGFSWASLGDPALAERIRRWLSLPLAGMSAYRFLLRPAGRPAPAAVGAVIYALSPVALWGYSQGRLPFLLAYAILPRLADRIGTAVGVVERGRGRFVIGTGAFLACGIAFWPGIVLPVVLLVAVYFILPEERRRRFRGLTLLAFAGLAGAILAFPLVIDLVLGRGSALTSFLGSADPVDAVRLVAGPGAWAWPVAWFVVIAAILGFALSERRGPAVRFLVIALAGAAAAWASVAGYLPQELSNAPAYLALAALCDVALITLGLSTALGHIAAARIGPWKLCASLLVGVVAVGVALTSLLAMFSPWEVGDGKLPPAWPIVANAPGTFRVLWITGDQGRSFPAPGGDPQGWFDEGENRVWWSITDRTGASVLDTARDERGPGYDYVLSSLAEAHDGTTHHLGTLLAPAGIAFIVTPEDGVPDGLRRALDQQFDLELDPAGSLDVYRNTRAPLVAELLPGDGFAEIPPGDLGPVLTVPTDGALPLVPTDGGWTGAAEEPSSVWIADQAADGWVLEETTGPVALEEQLGWGIGGGPVQGDVRITYRDQSLRNAEIAALIVLWLFALWVTRKPVRR